MPSVRREISYSSGIGEANRYRVTADTDVRNAMPSSSRPAIISIASTNRFIVMQACRSPGRGSSRRPRSIGGLVLVEQRLQLGERLRPVDALLRDLARPL